MSLTRYQLIFRTCVAVVVLMMGGVLLVSPVNARERHALIIANQDYLHGGSLSNPIRDSKALAQTLRQAGFQLQIETNLGYREMRTVISEFGLKHSETENVAMVYYSGHGAEFDGENYLIPVDAKFEDARKARHEAIRLTDVQNFMYRELSDKERAAGKNAKGLNIIVLDACRNNPYPARARSRVSGLSEVEGASGTLIWYAAQPGGRADDGDETSLSPFAASFVEALDGSAGETVEDTFKQVARLTLRATGGLQEPWQGGNILGRFSFHPDFGGGGNRILAEFDPAQLDRPVKPFAPEIPFERVIKRFGKWVFGNYTTLGKEVYEDQLWDFDASRTFRIFENKGPLFDVFSPRGFTPGTRRLKPMVWRRITDGTFFGFNKYEDKTSIELMFTQFSDVFIDKPRDVDAKFAITFHRSDGSLLPVDGKPFHTKTMWCRGARCGANTKFDYFAPRNVVIGDEEFALALDNADHIKVSFNNANELGVRPDARELNVDLAGAREAWGHMKGEQSNVPAPNQLPEYKQRSGDTKVDVFDELLTKGAVVEAILDECGRLFSEHTAEHIREIVVSCNKNGYGDGTWSYAALLARIGADRADQFREFFVRARQSLSALADCPDSECLFEDNVGVRQLREFAAGYMIAFLEQTGLPDGFRPAPDEKDLPQSVRLTLAEAKKFENLYRELRSNLIPREEVYRIANPEKYYDDKLEEVAGNIVRFSKYGFVEILDNYVKDFPEGDGPWDHAKIRSLIKGLNFDTKAIETIKDRKEVLLSYVDTSRHHAQDELEQGAWARCQEEAGLSVSSATQCYGEFAVVFPESERLVEARQIVLDLKQQKACGTATQAWKLVSLSSDRNVLDAFVREYPDCAETAYAQEKLATLE